MCNRQTTRNNVTAYSPKQYFCRSVFIPYLDHLLSELKSRFSTANAISSKALCLIPLNLHLLDEQQERSIANHFAKNTFPVKFSNEKGNGPTQSCLCHCLTTLDLRFNKPTPNSIQTFLQF